MPPILEVRDLVKTFTMHAIGGRRVASLRGVSFDLHRGEHVAVAGASGAGKSSLLRCLYRNYLPDSGSVTLCTDTGRVSLTDLDDRSMARIRGRDFGYVSQFLQAIPRTGPLELVTRSARRRGLDRDEATDAAAVALRKLGIDERLWEVDCNVLSGGERQRVNLAAGTVSPPRLLLLDEPVSALDPANRERALALIDELAHQRSRRLPRHADHQPVGQPGAGDGRRTDRRRRRTRRYLRSPIRRAGGNQMNTMGWPLATQPTNYTIRNVRAVLPDQVLHDATLVIRDGRIAAIEQGSIGDIAELDGSNRLLLPGLIDIHTDALEKERLPRPGAVLPWDFALTSFESKLVGAGITTVFHGAGFQHQSAHGKERSVELALEMCSHIDPAPRNRVDHRVLHRVDIRSAAGLDALRQRLADLGPADSPPLVSHEDHTPGQGQYVDRGHLERYIVHSDGKTPREAAAEVDRLIAEAEHTSATRDGALEYLGELARAGRIRLMGHDPDTVEVVDAMLARGAAASEFPTTLAAARRSKDVGLANVAGAPNVLRGGSHAGNVSASELIAAGLIDALASDYLPSGLLAAVRVLVRDGVCTLPAAVALVTSGPARVAGLTDRGELSVGKRADLLLVDDQHHAWPHAVATLTAPTSSTSAHVQVPA